MLKKILSFVSSIFVAAGVFFGVYRAPVQPAFAAGTENAMDISSVEDDLGENFDWSLYPQNKKGDFELLQFVEYCYTDDLAKKSNYSLYLYVYNPAEIIFSPNNNVVNMAVSYNEDGSPDSYENIPLRFCDYSNGDYAFRIYKYRIDIPASVYTNAWNCSQKNGYRQYDIAGIQLRPMGDLLSKDNFVSRTFKCTGYAKGYDESSLSESTYECVWTDLETVELNVNHTFYRSLTSMLGVGHQNQLDTVYFSVPKRFIEQYGRLQRIKAEWYEYKTKEILVTSHNDFYNKANTYIGVNLGPKDQSGMQSYNEDIYYSLGINAGDAGGGFYMAKWGWNLGNGFLHVPCEVLYYMFPTDNISEYDPYASVVDIGGVKSNVLYEYIKNYNKTFENGTLPIKNGSISADLFESDIDDSRKIDTENGKIQQGYSYFDFDADVDLQTLKSWSDTSPSFWENWINFGLGAAFTGGPTEESKTVAPIQILKASDLQGTNTEIASRLLINFADVDSLKAEYKDAVTVNGVNDEEKVVVLFRFATSDYYSENVDIMELGEGFLGADKYTKGQAYIAQESVFFDFDIIQLTFNDEGFYTVFPVVASPIDIVNDITPPVRDVREKPKIDWMKILIGLIILIIIVIVILAWGPGIIKTALKGLWKIISWPFKKIGQVVKSAPKKRKRRKR